MNDITLLAQNFLLLFMESAPWLLLGLLVAGLMHELVPISLLQKHMGSASTGAVAKAAVIGAPLPLCSCGVIPAAVRLSPVAGKLLQRYNRYFFAMLDSGANSRV